jgi:hypothetical protein
MLKELPKEGLVNLMCIFNAILRLEYWPKSLKIAQIVIIPKCGKNLMDVSSYRPISLLTTISKVLGKLILKKKINKDFNPQDWIPNHQFEFQQAQATVQQCHPMTDVINKATENQQYCTAAFLGVSQAFDKVWHTGLLLKIKRILPSSYFNLLKSYLNERQFETKFNGETQAASTSIPVYPKGAFLVLFSVYMY